jgi:hypothetical protein
VLMVAITVPSLDVEPAATAKSPVVRALPFTVFCRPQRVPLDSTLERPTEPRSRRSPDPGAVRHCYQLSHPYWSGGSYWMRSATMIC